MTGLMLDPRTATAVAIARAQVPFSASWEPASPDPAAIRAIGHDRFGIDFTDTEIRDAVKEATQR